MTNIRWFSTTKESSWQERQVSSTLEGEADLSLAGTRHARWQGFGGCFNELGWIALSSMSEKERVSVLDTLFDPRGECRFNFCRLPIGASDYAAGWYSHNEVEGDLEMKNFSIARDRKYLIPYIRQALARRPDLKLLASPWSPPTWMKYPPVYNYGRLIWKPEILQAYALYLVRFVQVYRVEGIRIEQVHVQNEPTADQKFPSCVWTGEHLREFIRDYLGPAFERHNLECEIWLGTLNTDEYDEYPNTVLSDPEARKYIAGVGIQWDGKRMIQKIGESWPEFPLMQTENECRNGDNSWEDAMYTHDLLRHYITNGVVAYLYWNMALGTDNSSMWGWRQNSMITMDAESGRLTCNPEFYVMKHFSHFIVPGAVRLGLRGHWTACATAFENPDGTLVVVVKNPFKDSRKLTFEGKEKSFGVELPPESFNTLVVNRE